MWWFRIISCNGYYTSQSSLVMVTIRPMWCYHSVVSLPVHTLDCSLRLIRFVLCDDLESSHTMIIIRPMWCYHSVFSLPVHTLTELGVTRHTRECHLVAPTQKTPMRTTKLGVWVFCPTRESHSFTNTGLCNCSVGVDSMLCALKDPRHHTNSTCVLLP